MGFRILHLADVHLDTAFSGCGISPEQGRRLRDDLRASLERVVLGAAKDKYDALLIGGDLYEDQRTLADTGHFLADLFSRVAPLPVIIAPGNHDPFRPGSHYAEIAWSANVHLFREAKLQPHPLTPGITLWGAAHTRADMNTPFLDGFRARGEGLHLLLLHGSDSTCLPPGKSSHAPFRPEQIPGCGFRFAFLGHYHAPGLHPADHPYYVYPGSLEPLGFDEEGVHGMAAAAVGDNQLECVLIPAARVRFITRRFAVDDITTRAVLARRISEVAAHEQLGGSVMRVILHGILHPDLDLDLEAIIREAGSTFRALRIDDTTLPPVTREAFEHDYTVRGRFVRTMLELVESSSGTEADRARLSLRLGLQALAGREINLP